MRKIIAVLAFSVAVSYAWPQSSLSGSHAAKIEELTTTTLKFQAQPEQALTLPSFVVFGYPSCSPSGVTVLDFMIPPDYKTFEFAGVASGGKIQAYPLNQIPGLASVFVVSFDASDSGIDALVSGQKADKLVAHSLAPHGSEEPRQPQPHKYFMLHLSSGGSSPEVIELDLPFRPSRIASLDENTWVILGFDRVNRLPVLTLVDHAGQILRYVDVEQVFGATASMINNASESTRKVLDGLPESERVGALLTLVQFVHYRGSLLLLSPGKNAKIVTLHKGGQIENMALHLPEGFEAKSIVSSDRGWFVRAFKRIDNSEYVDLRLLQLDPSSGDVVRLMSSPQLSPDDVTCIHNGEYLGIHWVGEQEDKKPYLMVGTE